MQDYVLSEHTVSVKQLCEEYHISYNTARRDINQLIARGAIEKTYGGVCAKSTFVPPAFVNRNEQHLDIKRNIAQKAAQFIQDGDIIYIDSGTTAWHIMEYLKETKNLTVITNSLPVINAAVNMPDIDLIALNGRLNRSTFSFIGHKTVDGLEDFNINKAFMAANGITVANGATQSTALEYEIKQHVVKQSSQVFLLVEAKKIGLFSLLSYCPLAGFDYIISEQEPPQAFLDAFPGRFVPA